MKVKRYIFHHFKFGYKLPYYKLLSYVFLGLLLSYALIDVINFLFWGLHIIFSTESTQGDLHQYIKNITKIISGKFLTIFTNTEKGNLIGFSYVLFILNIMVFHGVWWFNGIINFLLMGLMVYLIYRVLLTMPVSKYLRWVMLSWVVLMVLNANNLEFLGAEHGMPLYAYFMGILTLSLLLQFDKWKTYMWYKKYLYHGLFVICLFATTFIWSIGLLVPILVVLLLFLQRQYKYFFFYLLFCCVVLGMYYITIFVNVSIVGTGSKLQYQTFVNYIKFLFTMFATPASNGVTLHPYQIIMVYIWGSFVMILTIWAFYISKLFHVLNVKKYLTGRIQFEKWEIFFLGLMIWTFIIMMEIVIMRYAHVANSNALYGATLFFRRYYLNFYMFGIPLFIFIAMYVKKINVQYITWIMTTLVAIYVLFILTPNNNKLYGYYYGGIYNNSLQVAMGAQHVNGDIIVHGVNNFSQFWQLGGHHIWQKQLMNRNINKGISQNSAWFIHDKPCGQCLLFMETFQYEQGEFGVVPSNMKKMNTIHFKSIGRFPYYISNTVFISDETGKIVGLGFKKIHIVQQITPFNMLQYWNTTYDMEGYFYNYDSIKQHQYTLWAIAYNRKTISKLLTFTLKTTSKHQIHIWRS